MVKTREDDLTAGRARQMEEGRLLVGPQRRSSELARALRIFFECLRGFRALHFVGPCVTVFGSARFEEDNRHYQTARRIGGALARTARRMFGYMPLATRILPVTIDASPDALLQEARSLTEEVNEGDGVLVLTDMYGSTPSNIAFGLMQPGHIHVVTGINLPMLIRTLNYPLLDLAALTKKAISGGREGIFCCTLTEQQAPHAES